MAFAYAPEMWREFFSVVSLAAGTLMGLLAVALSLNIRAIAESPARIARARESLIALTLLLTLSIFALIPGQPRVALGVELVALSVVVLVLSLRLELMTIRRLPPQHRRQWMTRAFSLNTATLAIGIAGASLIMLIGGGLLWLIYSTLYALVWSTYNAWSLTIRLPGALEGETQKDDPGAAA